LHGAKGEPSFCFAKIHPIATKKSWSPVRKKGGQMVGASNAPIFSRTARKKVSPINDQKIVSGATDKFLSFMVYDFYSHRLYF
jgi:hypothetical protein